MKNSQQAVLIKETEKAVPGYSWLVVGILWVVAFLNYLDRILITSMRDPIVADFSLTDAQFGLLTSVFLWSYGFLSPFGGFFADKYSRKKVIVFSVLIWSAVTLWTGFVTSFEEMLAAGVVLTGGSAKMEGVIELAEEVFHLPVRLGLPTHVGGLVEVVRNPIHATGVGLLLFGNEQVSTGHSESVMSEGFKGMLARMKSWFQGNF